MKQRGFTLLELLVVIAIIGLLATIAVAALATAREKARTVQKLHDLNQLSKALELYYDEFGAYPPNIPSGNPNIDNFFTRLQPLVDNGFIAKIPVSPDNDYYYHRYASGNIGALIKTRLLTEPNSLTSIPPSCRPFGANWCSNTLLSKDYCLCHPY